jgi:hypothetical protein
MLRKDAMPRHLRMQYNPEDDDQLPMDHAQQIRASRSLGSIVLLLLCLVFFGYIFFYAIFKN